MLEAIETKLTEHRGAPRVWLQGGRLLLSGFTPGTQFNAQLFPEEHRITLTPAKVGTNTVSKKKSTREGEPDTPIIDLNNSKLLSIFKGVERLRIILSKGVIHILMLATDKRIEDRKSRLIQSISSGQIKTGSLSHGGGVLDLSLHDGFSTAGLNTSLMFANEIRKELLEQAQAFNPCWNNQTIPLAMPMQEMAFDSWLMNKLPKVDLLAAGIPCEGASLSGRSKNAISMPEAHVLVGGLIAPFLAIVAAVNPSIVLVENVPPYQNSASMCILRNQLRDFGYIVHETILDGEDFGAIEKRKRMAMVAVTRGIEFSMDSIITTPAENLTLGDILEPIEIDSPLWSPLQYLKDKEERDIKAGKGFTMNIVSPQSKTIGTIGKGYGKIRATEPKIQHSLDANLLRQLTPTEHARAKQIPEVLISYMGKTLAHELLGQSIIFSAFKQVGVAIANALKNWALTNTLIEKLGKAPQEEFALV